MKEKILSILGLIGVLVLMGGCTTLIVLSDSARSKDIQETRYFRIVDKDYKDLSSTMFDSNMKFIVKAYRLDKDKKRLTEYSSRAWEIVVTKYNYDRLEVGKTYSKRESRLR